MAKKKTWPAISRYNVKVDDHLIVHHSSPQASLNHSQIKGKLTQLSVPTHFLSNSQCQWILHNILQVGWMPSSYLSEAFFVSALVYSSANVPQSRLSAPFCSLTGHVKGCSRNYPGGGWATFFFRPLHPQNTHGVRAPRPPGHVSALINPPPTMAQICLDLQDKLLPHSPPLGHTVNKTPPPQDKKVSAAHPPLRIISGTALTEAGSNTYGATTK